jgi:hypothetical protein
MVIAYDVVQISNSCKIVHTIVPCIHNSILIQMLISTAVPLSLLLLTGAQRCAQS